MAIHYNLSKVHAISGDDPDFVNQIIDLFITDVPLDLDKIKEGIKIKDCQNVGAVAHKLKPTLDLFGLKVAFEELLQIEDWAKVEGNKKGVKEVFKSIKKQVDDAIKELRKDFNKNDVSVE